MRKSLCFLVECQTKIRGIWPWWVGGGEGDIAVESSPRHLSILCTVVSGFQLTPQTPETSFLK